MVDRSDDPDSDAPLAIEVTRVRAVPGDPARTRVELADGRRLVVDSTLAAQLGLTKGTRLAGAGAEEVVLRGEEGAAKERALRYLKDRDRSRVEVERRLARYGYSTDTVAAVIVWLSEIGYLDDRRFAESFVRSRNRAGWGPRRFNHELVKRGVDKRVADEAVRALQAEQGDDGDPAAALAEMVARRFERDLGTDPVKARRRIQGYLQRRGYEWDTIKEVLDRVSAGPEEG
jgi:regulatory protein